MRPQYYTRPLPSLLALVSADILADSPGPLMDPRHLAYPCANLCRVGLEIQCHTVREKHLMGSGGARRRVGV